MNGSGKVRPDAGAELLDLYDTALPEVYGYLLARCGQHTLAEDLTAETFLAAVTACRRQPPPAMSTGWLVGIARHKLVDHWRATEREERGLPDDGRARAFYGTVLGWRFRPGNLDGYWHPTNADGGFTRPMSGLSGGHPAAAVVPTFRVPDVAEAAVAVRAAGGTSTAPASDHGTTGVVCTDDQGTPFLLTQP